MDGWIKLHRSLLDWEWYSDSNVMRLFIHCLLKANIEDKNWRGVEIKRGEFHTSYNHLSQETKMSIKEIRIALNKLIKTKSVASIGASNGTKIIVLKYEDYQQKPKAKGQAAGQDEGKQGASEGQQLKNIRLQELKKLGFDDSYLEVVFIWFEYKKARKESYKSDKSIQAFYNKLIKLSGGSQAKATEIIEQSMANNWAGIFELKKDLPKKEEWNRNGDFNN